jgi:hypothetical protein
MDSACRTLETALALLQADAPAAYFRILAELDGLAIALRVDDEPFVVRGARYGLELEAGAPGGAALSIELQTSRHAIVALIDGELNLLDAVLARELALRAEVRLLDRLARAGRAFAEGALRSRRMRALLDDFRAPLAL